jgi:glycerophosphoryl diester phosphodiesterase
MTGRAEAKKGRTLVIAHRTAPLDAPENSLEGIDVAAALGADLVEVDVRGTRDGVPVLLHDPFLFRTTGRWWPVRLVSSDSVARTRLAGSEGYVPLLRDALARLPPGMGMAIEIKDHAIAPATLAEVRRAEASDRVLLWSESHRTVPYLAEAAPEIEVALLRATGDPDERQRMIDDALRWGARAVSIAHTEVDPALVAALRSHGLRVYSCLRDLPSRIPDQVGLLDGVITDHVADAVALVARDSGP